jgi:hypothetical protein
MSEAKKRTPNCTDKCAKIYIPITVAIRQESAQSTREKGIVQIVAVGDVRKDDPFRLGLRLQRCAPEPVVVGRLAGRRRSSV